MRPVNQVSKRVLLFYLYGQQNAGDAAIGLGALAFFQKYGYLVTAFSRWPSNFPEFEKDKQFYEKKSDGVLVLGGPFVFRRSKSMLRNIAYYIASALRFVLGADARRYRALIRDSSLVVLNGGNLLRCQGITDALRLLAFTYPLHLARKFNKDYIILPQSTATINRFGRLILQPLFESASVVWVREESSIEQFREYFPHCNFQFAPDMAFHMIESEVGVTLTRANEGANVCKVVKVAVTLRAHSVGDIHKFDRQMQSRILTFYMGCLNMLVKKWQVEVTIIVQCKKDREIALALRERIRKNSQIVLVGCNFVEEYDPYELCKLYHSQSVLIGMRLHSIILALSVGIPCVGFFDPKWGLKNPGLMEGFGLPAIFLESNFGQEMQTIEEVVDHREEYSKNILNRLRAQRERFSNRCFQYAEKLSRAR